ncbi:Sip1-related alpha-galactosidase [Pelagicoccus sp. SDUM812005]|uniref:Sip1-related alpha-galactosidase n=1 Tax=Pelagicoccus sp. SDUM812005 TaxID=3041257 RepID=UPI00280DE78C|nr:Sip1-related alpha-galactosidase [Pelagicoccus sp. SDUM812005]MDQ8182552.1 Sip1-related alpha-galactosidase [Pelagicoccus sp. SDUM812005]
MKHSTLIKGVPSPAAASKHGFSQILPSSDLPASPELLELQSCLAIARSGPFWFEPFFAKQPAKLGELAEIALLLWETAHQGFVALLPLASSLGRAKLSADANGLSARWIPCSASSPASSEHAFALGCHSHPREAIALAVAAAQKELGTFLLREEKPEPRFIDRLGWCTWDAFYQDVSEKGILEGLEKLKSGGIAPGFLIIDDGWQKTERFRMVDFATDEGKFPQGLGAVIEAAKRDYGIERVGVWHALQGYWQGVDPQGPLSQAFSILACPDASGTFDDWPEQFATQLRHLVDPTEIAQFYDAFYQWLKSQGVDFVKVDNQAMIEQFAGERLPRVSTQLSYQAALQGASQRHFQDSPLHCMCNVSEILLNLSQGNLWRNTDDFFPLKPDAYQADFVTWNAYNSLLSSHFAIPDWDMFQSKAEHAPFHAAARAISGGPIYLSDKPGEHDFELIHSVSLPDGTVPRWPQPAGLPVDRLLEDPRQGSRLLKIANYKTPTLGAIAMFNVSPATAPDGQATSLSDTFSPADIPSLTGERFAVFDSQSESLQLLDRDASATVTLAPLQATTLTLASLQNGVAALGATELLNGGAVLVSAGWQEAGKFVSCYEAGGTRVGFYSETPPLRATANGNPAEIETAAQNFYRVRIPNSSQCVVELEFPL